MSVENTPTILTIESLSDEILDSYRRLLPHQVSGGQDFVQWKFATTPVGPGLFSVARVDGEIVGLSAYMRQAFKLGSTSGSGYQAIDSIVAERMQGQGLFTKLARSFSDEAGSTTDLIWGFPNANAAPAWFRKLDWRRHGFAPFLVKPLRSGYLLRKLSLPQVDVRLSILRDRGAAPVAELPPFIDELWGRFSRSIDVAVARDRAYLAWRLFEAPSRNYRVVAEETNEGGALVATTLAEKHGGAIGYVMEAMGADRSLADLLRAELGRMVDQGAEVALAWCHPWSPNYRAYRMAGFTPLPERLRPVEIHVGSRAYSALGQASDNPRGWYLSYLDSDTN